LIQRGLRTFFQHFTIPYPAFARIAGEFEILRKFERINWTSVFAKAAKHTTAQVVGKICKFLAASLLIARARNNNQIFRARDGAEITCDAHSLVGIGIDVKARCTTITLSDFRPLHRVLLGVDFLGVLIAKGDLKALQQIDEENLAQQVGYRHNGRRIPPEEAGCQFLRRELLPGRMRINQQEDDMRAYLAKLSPMVRMALGIPLLLMAYPVVMIVLPAVLRAMVPDVVRSVLSLL
jgi:hypothetical protein